MAKHCPGHVRLKPPRRQHACACITGSVVPQLLEELRSDWPIDTQ